MSQSVVVLGGGSFATVLANIIAKNGIAVRLWARDESLVTAINKNHCNPRYLPDYQLHADITAYVDIALAMQDADFILIAVPSSAYRSVAQLIAPFFNSKIALVSTAKGFEIDSFKMMTKVLQEELPELCRIGVLSGPNIAAELAQEEIAATVIASTDTALQERIHELLYCSYLRVYSSSDMHGVELAGALKNIYAIVAGIATGRGVGFNTIALLITRSLVEMRRFAVSMGARTETFLGLAGNGDLIVTCLSPDSRNFRFGKALAEGNTIEEAIATINQTIEGLNTLKVVHKEATQRNLYMPLLDGLYKIIYEKLDINLLPGFLMHAHRRADVEDTDV